MDVASNFGEGPRLPATPRGIMLRNGHSPEAKARLPQFVMSFGLGRLNLIAYVYVLLVGRCVRTSGEGRQVMIRAPQSDLRSVVVYRVGSCPMSKSMGLVGALGAFGALAYLLNPLPPESQSTVAVATANPTANQAPSPAAAPASQAAVLGRVAPSPPPAQDTTVRLVQQIQTELLRLGCYSGAVDGRWSPETQQAMQTLGERVRVLRPVDTPDYIMLALARGQTSHLCAAPDRAAAARQPARVTSMAASMGTPDAPRAASPSRRTVERPQAAAQPARTRAAAPSAPIESRSSVVEAESRTIERAIPVDDDTDNDLGQSRMGLGAAAVDPLRAGIDPRDPTAPAILRGPPTPSRTASNSGITEIVPPPAEKAARTAARPPSFSSMSGRGDWKRNFFNRVRENGP